MKEQTERRIFELPLPGVAAEGQGYRLSSVRLSLWIDMIETVAREDRLVTFGVSGVSLKRLKDLSEISGFDPEVEFENQLKLAHAAAVEAGLLGKD